LTPVTQLAIELARRAGEVVRKKYDEVETSVRHKSSFVDLVTDADKACEGLIIDGIRARYPDHAILSEESGASGAKGGVRWVIDPLDGTVNYAHRVPHFCVIIAVEDHGTVISGVTYDPMRDELFVAEKGQGTTVNGRPVRVSHAPKLPEALIGTGFAYDRLTNPSDNQREFCRMNLLSHGVRRMGSAGLDLAYVASGRFDGFWEGFLNAWDVGAGSLQITEAGGTITRLDGSPFSLGEGGVIASNGPLQDIIRRALASAQKYPANSRDGLEEFLPADVVRQLRESGAG
jgi:myo-inositol-1(or 4)-monophosphatase